jgi:hypothetical protein
LQNVLERFDPGRLEMPKCGTDIHTSKVTAYNVNNTLCLVDFPGGNGLGAYADEWKQFAALPSSCVLLFNFQVPPHHGFLDKSDAYIDVQLLKLSWLVAMLRFDFRIVNLYMQFLDTCSHKLFYKGEKMF